MKSTWVRLEPDYKDGTYYIMTSNGHVFCCREQWVDRTGKPRQIKEAEKMHRRIYRVTRIRRISLKLNKHGLLIGFLPQLEKGGKVDEVGIAYRMLTHLGPPKPEGAYAAGYKDGNPANVKLENLYWKERDRTAVDYKSKCRKMYKEAIGVLPTIRYYLVPQDHLLYKRYMDYLDNREELRKIAKRFLKKEGLKCRQIKAYQYYLPKKAEDGSYKDKLFYQFKINDKNKKFIEHDREVLGPQLNVTADGDGFYQFRKNSAILKRWTATMQKKSFDILDVPDIKQFTDMKERQICKKSFAMYGKALFLRIETKGAYTVDKEIKQVKGVRFIGEEEK